MKNLDRTLLCFVMATAPGLGALNGHVIPRKTAASRSGAFILARHVWISTGPSASDISIAGWAAGPRGRIARIAFQ
jgi:hypothetical protein